MADQGLAGTAAGGGGPAARRDGTLGRWLIAGRGLMLAVLPPLPPAPAIGTWLPLRAAGGWFLGGRG